MLIEVELGGYRKTFEQCRMCSSRIEDDFMCPAKKDSRHESGQRYQSGVNHLPDFVRLLLLGPLMADLDRIAI